MFEEEKKIIQEYLNLFSLKLQEIQENQAVLAQNQALLAEQNNKLVAAAIALEKRVLQLDKDLFEDEGQIGQEKENNEGQ